MAPSQDCIAPARFPDLPPPMPPPPLLLLLQRGGAIMELAVGEVMTASPKTCPPEAKAAAAMALMEAPPKVNMLPVVDAGGRVEGLVTLHALVSAGL